mgnify:FL=1
MTDFEFKNNNVYIKSDSFDLRQTLDCGQAFRFSSDENGVWSGVVKNRVVTLFEENKKIVIKDMSREEFENYFYEYFTFDIDYSKLKELLSNDETLKKAISYSPGIRILKQEKFETVCSFIFSQNNNIPRIKGIINRFCENFGEKIDENNYSFPNVEKIASLTVEDLAPIRAGFRAKYIIDAAQKIKSGEVKLEKLETMDITDAREELMKIKGVGPKVAECVLLFSCKRLEAFPVDVWIKKVMLQLYPNGLPDCTKGIEGIAQQYLFDYARSIKL